ncbi:hypothetical protein R6Q59_015073 [Mikania micrantha]
MVKTLKAHESNRNLLKKKNYFPFIQPGFKSDQVWARCSIVLLFEISLNGILKLRLNKDGRLSFSPVSACLYLRLSLFRVRLRVSSQECRCFCFDWSVFRVRLIYQLIHRSGFRNHLCRML